MFIHQIFRLVIMCLCYLCILAFIVPVHFSELLCVLVTSCIFILIMYLRQFMWQALYICVNRKLTGVQIEIFALCFDQVSM